MKLISRFSFLKQRSSRDTNVFKGIFNQETKRRKTDVTKDNLWVHNARYTNCESWARNGEYIFPEVNEALRNDYKRIKRKKSNKPIDVAILGPGKGIEVIEIKNNFFKESKTNIDTFGLTNSLSDDARKLVRNNFFTKKVHEKEFFEHMNHLEHIKKYDYIYSHLGPAYHTNYPEIVLLKIGSMLRPGGFARIHLGLNFSNKALLENVNEYLKVKGLSKELCIKFHSDSGTSINWIYLERLK